MRFWSYGTSRRGVDLRSSPSPSDVVAPPTLAECDSDGLHRAIPDYFGVDTVFAPPEGLFTIYAPYAFVRGMFITAGNRVHISPPEWGCPCDFLRWGTARPRLFPASLLPLHNGHFISILIDYTSFSTSNHHNKNCLVDDRQIVIHFNGYDKQGSFFSVR